jgi:zinc protease
MRLMAGKWLPGFAACLILGCASTDGESAAPIQYKLPNGLQVILRPLKGAQHTAIVTLFAIGGDHDPEGASGLAHFIEHLYVTTATGDLPVRSAEALMQAYPAGWNAQTGDDYTVYATVVVPSALDGEIKQHAQRMGDLRITDADLRRELPRIEQELTNMFGRIPAIGSANLARERVRPTPLRGRKGGRIDQLKLVTLEQLQSRWQQVYKPANATLVMAGEFEPAVIRPLIEADFGPIPAGDAAPPAQAPTPTEGLAPVRTVTVPAVQPSMKSTAALAYAAPKPGTPAYAPFLIIVNRLLMQTQQAGVPAPPTEPKLQYAFLDDPNVLTVSVELKEGESVEQAATRLRAFVDRALGAPWDANERLATKQNLAFFLESALLPEEALANNAYGAAFGLGRRHQLGLSGKSLATKLDRTTAKAVASVGDEYLSAARGAVAAVLTQQP